MTHNINNSPNLEKDDNKAVTATALLTYVAIVAGCAAIVKILTSSRGRVTIPGGITLSWGS